MGLSCVHTRGELGLLAPAVTVEVHLGGGLPGLSIVGLAEMAVRESRERVRAALATCGFDFPSRRITVNLAPADLPKSGGRFDLPIALGVLAASGQVPAESLEGCEVLGELAFSGAIRGVPGLLPALIAIRAAGRSAIVPAAGAAEAALLGTASIGLADHLARVARHLQRLESLPQPGPPPPAPEQGEDAADLCDVQGQLQAKRALEIAAAGGHHLLLVGPPGTGKSMLARRLPGLLPPMSDVEALESAALHSLIGVTPGQHWRRRPFRAPHHTASMAALAGGGALPRPGEISLAHHGVLFMDELPEFSRSAVEALREPLEAGHLTIARATRRVEYPARCQFVGAMNPCPCGFQGDPESQCRCTPDQVRNYQAKISGPFLDRLEIRLHVPRPRLQLRGEPAGDSSAMVAERVMRARQRQLTRAGVLNAHLSRRELLAHALPDAAGAALLENAAEKLRLSRRACDGVLRVARTIADLAGEPGVRGPQISEALTLRRGLGL